MPNVDSTQESVIRIRAHKGTEVSEWVEKRVTVNFVPIGTDETISITTFTDYVENDLWVDL